MVSSSIWIFLICVVIFVAVSAVTAVVVYKLQRKKLQEKRDNITKTDA